MPEAKSLNSTHVMFTDLLYERVHFLAIILLPKGVLVTFRVTGMYLHYLIHLVECVLYH